MSAIILIALEEIRSPGILYLLLDVTLSPQTHVTKQKQGSGPRESVTFFWTGPRVNVLAFVGSQYLLQPPNAGLEHKNHYRQYMVVFQWNFIYQNMPQTVFDLQAMICWPLLLANKLPFFVQFITRNILRIEKH